MPVIIISIVGIIIFLYVLIALITSMNVFFMSKVNLEMDPSAFDSPSVPTQWAKENMFDYIGKFRMEIPMVKMDIYAWRRTDRPTWFCTLIAHAGVETKEAYDLVTEFDSDIGLTTGSTQDSHMLPKPHESYDQSFSPADFDDRWTRHVEMENFLMDDGGAELIARENIFEELIVRSIRKQMRLIRQTPLWFLRTPLWYFFRRRKWHNLDIRQQHQKGYIKLPNEQTKQSTGYLEKPIRMI